MLYILGGILIVIGAALAIYDNIMCVATGAYTMGIEGNLKRPVMFISFAFMICGGFLFYISNILNGERPIKKLKAKYSKKVGFGCMPYELAPWREDIRRMCGKLGISGLKCIVEDDHEHLMSSVAVNFEWPLIIFSRVKIEKLLQMYSDEAVGHDMVLFAIGHELVHIKTGDSNERSNRMLTFEVLAVFVTGLAVTALITKFLGGVLLVLVRIIFALIFVCMWIYMVVWSDKRYWGGVKEFRADRIGFQVSGVNVDAVRNIGYFYIKYENMNATAKNSNDFHPPMERRVMEIERNGNKKWGIGDYIRFTLIFMKNKKWEAA